MTTELCTYTRNACDIARRTGVGRIELCAAPLEGGTTPSAGLIRYARSLPGLRLSVMIRPRGGDFLYTDDEVALMAEEIRLAREYGADRAFDMTRDSRQALEAVIRTGCRRVLTSGGRNTAQEGIETLRALAAQAAGRIEVMAGSGVGPSNARLLAATGVDALHFSARRERESGMRFRNPQVSMGGCAGVPEYTLTDELQYHAAVFEKARCVGADAHAVFRLGRAGGVDLADESVVRQILAELG